MKVNFARASSLGISLGLGMRHSSYCTIPNTTYYVHPSIFGTSLHIGITKISWYHLRISRCICCVMCTGLTEGSVLDEPDPKEEALKGEMEAEKSK